jgi:SM-20-related protein
MSDTPAPITFASGLQPEPAAAEFASRGRVRIRNVLDAASATRLHRCLLGEVPWRLVYHDGTRNVVVEADEFQKLEPAGQRDLMQRVLAGARERFQYLYNSYPMVTAYLNRQDPHLFLHRVLEWLNEAATLETVRQISGISSLKKADAQATLYRPGHFLTLHDDGGTGNEMRRVAYVLNMTEDWRADWGGQLQFMTADGEVEESWIPGFNTLALFRVPMKHAVSYVAPYATRPRLAVTGWFRDT